jgi:hypothetical protein
MRDGYGRPERLWDHRSGDCILLFLAVLNRVWPWEKRRAHNDLIGWQLRVLGTTYAVILGFMLYTVWTTYSEADLNVDLEADSVMRIYRLAEGLAEPQRTQLQTLRVPISMPPASGSGRRWLAAKCPRKVGRSTRLCGRR